MRGRLTLKIGALTVMLATAIAGCPGPTFIVQQYTGPAQPEGKIASLRVNGSDTVRLITLDEQDANAPIPSDSHLHVEMLPGRHSVSVGDTKFPNAPPQSVEFVAEAGKFYRIAFADGRPRVYEITRSSDTITRDVTAADAPPPRPVLPKPAPAPAAPEVNDAGASDAARP